MICFHNFQTNFIEKNQDVVPKAINDICKNIHIRYRDQDMSDRNTPKANSHSRSATRTLKEGITTLIKQLTETVSSSLLYRCTNGFNF